MKTCTSTWIVCGLVAALTLNTSGSLQAIEWRCQNIIPIFGSKRVRVLQSGNQTIEVAGISSKLTLNHWGTVAGDDSDLGVDVQHVRYPSRPSRDDINRLVGWEPGTKKIVVALEEMDLWRIGPSANWRQAIIRRIQPIPLMIGNAVGFTPSRFSFHWGVYSISADGKWNGSHSQGPFRGAEARNRLPNHNAVLIPLEFDKREQVEAISNSIASMRGGMSLSCSNHVCQVLGSIEVEPKKNTIMSSRTTLSELAAQKLGPVKKIIVLGTHLQGPEDIDWATFVTDARSLRERVFLGAALANLVGVIALNSAILYYDVMSLIAGRP
jgi:hypothetical protein